MGTDTKVTMFSGEKKAEERISPEAKLLKSIDLHLRYLAYVLITLGLCAIGVGIALVVQLNKYVIFEASTLNGITTNAAAITQNAATMTTLATPIVSNLQYVTSALTAAVYSATNSTHVEQQAAAARETGVTTQRRLHSIDPATVDAGVVPATAISTSDLIMQDYKLREALYKSTRHLMATLNTKADEFDPAAVSRFLDMLTNSTNMTGIAVRFDRVMTDVERVSHFGVLASSMLGIAAAATNTSLPSPGDLIGMYSQQKAAATPQGHSTCR
jgi:hypothetical protein